MQVSFNDDNTAVLTFSFHNFVFTHKVKTPPSISTYKYWDNLCNKKDCRSSRYNEDFALTIDGKVLYCHDESEDEEDEDECDNSGVTNHHCEIKFLFTDCKNAFEQIRNKIKSDILTLLDKGETPSFSSGFLKPVMISDELAAFTGLDKNLYQSRVEITKCLCDYIKKNKLNNPQDQRYIDADDALMKLFGKDKFTYYAMQSYLKNFVTVCTPEQMKTYALRMLAE